MIKIRVALPAVALAVGLCAQAVSGAQAGTSQPGAVASPALAVVTGSLPVAASPSAPARVYLFGERFAARPKIGQIFPTPVLASLEVTTGLAFRLAVPDSAAVRSLFLPASHTLNVQVEVVSARGVSSWFTDVNTKPAGGAAAASETKVGKLPAYDMTALRKAAAIQGMTPSALVAASFRKCVHDCIQCDWKTINHKYNYATRINELHAANGITATYSHWTKADSTFTVGFEAAGESGWKADGTIGISKDAATGASLPKSGYYSRYIDGKYDYAMYREYAPSGYQCAGAGNRKQHPTEWDGTIEPGAKAKGRRNNSCKGAVNYVTIPSKGASNWKQVGHSFFWKVGVSTPWGFSFGDRTGYSGYTKEMWKSHRSGRSYLCGPHNDTSHFSDWTIVYNYNSR